MGRIAKKYRIPQRTLRSIIERSQDGFKMSPKLRAKISQSRRVYNYTDEERDAALTEIRNGAPCYRVARAYNIPERTLRSYIEKESKSRKEMQKEENTRALMLNRIRQYNEKLTSS